MARSSLTAFNGLAGTVTPAWLRDRLPFFLDLSCLVEIVMITEKQKRFLRSRAHSLKPVVTAGNAGITAGVLNEINLTLSRHELIKVRISGADRVGLKSMTEQICKETNASAVQIIGHIVILYRPADKPVIQLP